MFSFQKEKPGYVIAKKLSHTSEQVSFMLLKSNYSVPGVAEAVHTFIPGDEICDVSDTLRNVLSAKDSTRRNYLETRILDPYCRGNHRIKKDFFGSGISEVKRTVEGIKRFTREDMRHCGPPI